MNTKSTILRGLLLFLALPISVLAQGLEVDGVVGLYPVGENSCVAVEVPAGTSQPLIALSWYNNDATTTFPRLLLVEGLPGVPPDVNDPGLVLETLTGESLAWGNASFGGPIVSSTGTAYAVFFFPPYAERTGEGLGGGAGIGYRAGANGPTTFLSHDGFEWVQMQSDFSLAVEPVHGAMKGGKTRTLSEIGDRVALAEPVDVDTPQSRAVTALFAPYPNPFNPSVSISFELAAEGEVELRVYDPRGRRVRILAAGERGAGVHRLVWHGNDDRGQPVASGVYYVRMIVADQTHEKTVTLVR